MLMLFLLHFCEVSYDVRATVLVDSYITFFHHIIHTVDCELSKLNLLFTCVHLLLQFLDLVVLLLQFAAQTLPVILSSSFLVELRGCLDLSPASLGARLKQMYGSTVSSYEIEQVRKESKSVYLLLIIVEASNALAIAGSSSIIRSCFEATLSLRSRIFSWTHQLNQSPTNMQIKLATHDRGIFGRSRSSGKYSLI